MRFSLTLVALIAVSGALAREIPGLEDFPDIKRIRTRSSKKLNQKPLSALNVLSHLTQAQAVGPRRRSFSPRVGLPQPLPLEPRPYPLPPNFRQRTSQSYPAHENRQELTPYRPRPEIRNPATQTFNEQLINESIELPENVRQQEPSFEIKRRPRPNAYIEDDTLYRKPSVEETNLSNTPSRRPSIVQNKPVRAHKNEAPVYSKRRPNNHALKYVPETVYEVREPVFVSKPSNIKVKQPQRVLPTKTRHRNRPQYSENVASEEPEAVNHPPQKETPKFSKRPESFDFPRRQNSPSFIQEHKPSQTGFQPTKVETVFKTSPSSSRRRRPGALSEYSRPAPTKVSKKKKFSRYSFDKDPKKDKRAVYGGDGHLDQNGLEFVQQSQKAENSRGGRIAFQMHGQQGPHSYRFGFDTGKGANRQFRYEERDGHGEVKGRYGYYDKHGKLQVVNYSAHPKHGFSADVPKY